MERVRFRPHQSILVVAFIAFVSMLPLVFGPELPTDTITTHVEGASTASLRPIFLPLLLIPIVLFLWVLRSGTDVDSEGIRVRALLGTRRIGWWEVRELASDPRGRAVVLLNDGHAVNLPSVRGKHIRRVIEAGGKRLERDGEDAAPAQ